MSNTSSDSPEEEENDSYTIYDGIFEYNYFPKIEISKDNIYSNYRL